MRNHNISGQRYSENIEGHRDYQDIQDYSNPASQVNHPICVDNDVKITKIKMKSER